MELEEEDLEIIRKQRVNGRDFLKVTEENWYVGSRLADFAKECKEKKLRAFSSWRKC